MGGDSRSDLQALQRSGRTKVVALAMVMLGALAAAAWFLIFEPHGEGSPERSDKVLIVRGTQVAGYSGALGRMGFDAAEGSLQHWEEKTQAELPEFEGSAVQGVVALADHFGYGFVAFEHPQDVDFSDLDFEQAPEFDTHVRFAVLSIGDFALPHHVTMNAPVPAALRRLEYPLLDALFQQEELAKTLPGSEVNDIDVLQRRSQLERAIAMLELRQSADALAGTVESGWTKTLLAAGGVSSVGLRGQETGVAQPLPDGRLLAAVESFEVITRDGVRADLERSGAQQLFVGALGADERTRCETLSGGELSATGRLTFSPGARSVVVQDDGRSSLWRWQKGTPCGYVSAGRFATELDPLGLAVHDDGHVARLRTRSVENAGIEVWAARADDARAGKLQRIAELGDVTATSPVWLDANHIAVVSGEKGRSPKLQVFAATEDGARFEVVLATAPVELRSATLAGPSALLLTFVRPDDGAGAVLWRLEAPQPWADLLRVPEDAGSMPVMWDAQDWNLAALTHGGDARDVAVSPDGARAAFVWSAQDGPGEIVVTDAVRSAPLLELTADSLDDRAPRFDATGTHLVFQTRTGVPKTAWTVSVPRSVAVPGA